MAYKIYKTGNVVHLVDTATNKDYEGLASNFLPRRLLEDSMEFSFTGLNGFDSNLSINVEDFLDENGDPFADYTTFYSVITNFNSGGATPQNIFTAVFSLTLETAKYAQSYLGGDFDDFTFGNLFFEDGTGFYQADTVNNLDDTYRLLSFNINVLSDTISSTKKIIPLATILSGSLNLGALTTYDGLIETGDQIKCVITLNYKKV